MKNADRILSFIRENTIGTVFVFSDKKDYYLDCFIIKAPEEEPVIYDTCRVKQGMFQDEVFCQIKDDPLFDFRFFPYKNNRLKFFSWSDDYRPVYLVNEGEKGLETDTPFGYYLIPPGEILECKKGQEKYRIEKPVVPAIDRYCVNDVYVHEDGSVSYGQPNNDPQITYVKDKKKKQDR